MANRYHQPHAVYIRQFWAAGWTFVPGLYCDWAKYACAPDTNEAQLSRNYGGKVMTAGTDYLANRDPLEIEGYYVKVEISQDNGLGEVPPIKWIGIIVGTEDDRVGIQNIADEIGRQTWQCRGLEFLLMRKIVDSSFVKQPPAEGEDDDPRDHEIGRAIGFNLGAGRGNDSLRVGNRSVSLGTKATYIFAEALDANVSPGLTEDDRNREWQADQILAYLLAYQYPTDAAGIVKVPLFIDVGLSTQILTTFKPTLEAEGKTVFQLLNELIDRRRIMTWALFPTAIGGTVELPNIAVFTFNGEPLVLPSGTVVPANPRQGVWFQDDQNIYQSFRVLTEDATRVDQIIVRGEPLGACFTVSDAVDTLEPDWSEDLQDAYNAGANTDASYLLLDWEEKKSANEQVRTDDRLKKVYSYFRIPPTWDGTMNGTEIVCPNPGMLDDEDNKVSTEFWIPGLRFQHRLPLLIESDYTTVASITSESLVGSKPEYRLPFAVAFRSAESGTETDSRYYALDRLPQGGWKALLESGGRHYSASLRMQDDAPGIVIGVHGFPQHAIARAEFVATDDADATDYEADFDWKDIFATVFLEFDQRLEYRYPEVLTTETDAVRELIINVPNARLDYLTPGTVIGLDAAGALITTDGGYVRDDRERLKDIAVAASHWYGVKRRSIEAVAHDLRTTFQLGDLIPFVGDPATPVEVNSVITSMMFDLLAGTITFRTQFAELDLTAF